MPSVRCSDATPTPPSRPDRRSTVRAAAGCLFSFAVFCLAQHLAYVSHVDLLVYRAEGTTVLAGRDLYAMRAGAARLPATYPPFAALLFAPLALPPVAVLRVLGTLANLALLVAFVRLSARLVGRPAGTAAVLWTAAAAVWCEPVWATLRYGQVNLLLAVAVLADLTRRRPSRWTGVGIGLAAAVKLTPALFAVTLLAAALVRRPGGAAPPAEGARRAALRAAGTAAAAFAAATAVAAVLLPRDSRTYWGHLVLDSDRAGFPETTANQSLRGVLARLLHTDQPGLWWLAGAALAGAAGLAVAVRAERRGDRAVSVVATGLTALLVSPVSWTHHWVWCVPLVLLVRDRAGWRPAAAVALVFGSYAPWWVPHGPARPELAQSGGQMALSGLYALTAAGALVMLWRRSRTASECSARRAAGRRSAPPPARGTARSGRLL